MIDSSDKGIREEMTSSQQEKTNKRRVNLKAVQESLVCTMTQEEFAILARSEARRLNLRRAVKLSRSNVSMFLHDKIPEGQVYQAILSTVEKYLDVDELFLTDVDHDA